MWIALRFILRSPPDQQWDSRPALPVRLRRNDDGGDFVPGHDQKAIHERIARIGTVAEFLDWMDVVGPASLSR